MAVAIAYGFPGYITFIISNIQYNLDGSNTDGSFIVDDSNSFLSP